MSLTPPVSWRVYPRGGSKSNAVRRTRSQKLLTELLGTFGVVLISAGASVLIGNFPTIGPLGPLAIALAYGVAYGAAVAALGHISGGHFNPAVTIGQWVTHRFGLYDTVTYFAAQLGGAAAAAYALRQALSSNVAASQMLGPPSLSAGLTRGPAMLIEGTMTFVLVLAICASTGGARSGGNRYWIAGIAAGVVIVAASLAGAAYTGAAMNPARAFGLALAARQWAYQGVYWVGPLGGGVAAATLYELLFHRALPSPEKTPS